MMRSLLLLGCMLLAAAKNPTMEEKGECMVDGAEAANELLDAGMYIWAAVKRCDDGAERVKCAVDISSAIRSVNEMINIILKALNKCGALKMANPDCGLAASTLTQHLAGISESSADIIQKCPNSLQPARAPEVDWHHHNSALCLIDLKDTAQSLLAGIRAFSRVKGDCNGEAGKRACGSNALRLIAAFAGLGHYLSGAIGHCSHTPKIAHCGSEIADLVRHTTELARAGIDLSEFCGKPSSKGANAAKTVEVDVPIEVGVRPRLYEQVHAARGSSRGSLNTVLAALLPVIAVVGFVGGRCYAKRPEVVSEPLE